MKCKVLNRTKFDISHCSLTDLGHGNVSASVHLNVHQPPDKNWMVSYGIWRDQGGLKPFFHNISLDFCRFLKNPSRLQLYYSFHKAILPFSNLNHSCPYTMTRFQCAVNRGQSPDGASRVGSADSNQMRS
nr:uncharacterized protein LOC6627198 [Drosophila virilis]